MTSDIKERTSITTIRFIAVTIAQFVVGLTLPMVNHFGHDIAQRGWLSTTFIFACVAFVLFLVAFYVSRERIQPPPHQEVNIKEDIKSTFSGFPVGIVPADLCLVYYARYVEFCHELLFPV